MKEFSKPSMEIRVEGGNLSEDEIEKIRRYYDEKVAMMGDDRVLIIDAVTKEARFE